MAHERGHAHRGARDKSEPGIVSALRKAGYLVMRLNEFDLLIYGHGRLSMLDCKTKGSNRRTDKQKMMLEQGWPLKFAETPEEAFKALAIN